MKPFVDNTAVLAPYAIEEALRAKAYETLDSAERAALKVSIARLYSLWERRDYSEMRVREFSAFSVREEAAPCSYALICCQVPLLRGGDIVPALLPALMAGVESVVPWFLGDKHTPLPKDMLLALELLGVEEAFHSTSQELAKLLLHDIPLSQEGRFVGLGQWPDNDYSLFSIALKQGVAVQYYDKGKSAYPSLTPQWFCNHSVSFLP